MFETLPLSAWLLLLATIFIPLFIVIRFYLKYRGDNSGKES